jgi:hypothetical protein
LVDVALPIVIQLSSLNPKTAKVADVAAAYRKYGVPLLTQYQENPQSLGNALLNLATEILRKKLPEASANIATNILNTAVQLAVTAYKGK